MGRQNARSYKVTPPRPGSLIGEGCRPVKPTGPEKETRRAKKLQSQTTPAKTRHLHWKLLTPDRRRSAVQALRARFGVSGRRACAVAGQHRSTQRHEPAPVTDEETRLWEWLRAFAVRRPRWGRKRAFAELRRLGWKANHKRIRLALAGRGFAGASTPITIVHRSGSVTLGSCALSGRTCCGR